MAIPPNFCGSGSPPGRLEHKGAWRHCGIVIVVRPNNIVAPGWVLKRLGDGPIPWDIEASPRLSPSLPKLSTLPTNLSDAWLQSKECQPSLPMSGFEEPRCSARFGRAGRGCWVRIWDATHGASGLRWAGAGWGC